MGQTLLGLLLMSPLACLAVGTAVAGVRRSGRRPR